MARKCDVCGETDPAPAWLCTARFAGVAKPGKPCSYSVEGHKRLGDKFKALSAQISSQQKATEGK